jgi:hypothetical protein
LENIINEILSIKYNKEKVRNGRHWVTTIRLSNGMNIYPNNESINLDKILSNDIISFLKLLLGMSEVELMTYNHIIYNFVKKLIKYE